VSSVQRCGLSPGRTLKAKKLSLAWPYSDKPPGHSTQRPSNQPEALEVAAATGVGVLVTRALIRSKSAS
jgi:hypothetical protein